MVRNNNQNQSFCSLGISFMNSKKNYISCRTFFGIFITRQWSLYIADELPPQETDEEKHARLIMKSARYSGGDMTEKAKRSKSYVLEGFTLREIDISQELEKQQQREREELEASGNMSKYATKYEDPEWVAQRAGMKQDDPKFDFNFLSGYFKRVDYRARGTDNLWEKTTNPHKKSNDPDIDIEALKERNFKCFIKEAHLRFKS